MLDPILTGELDTVPGYDRFPTVDEVHESLTRLAAAHPGTAELRRIGTSRLGEPMLCLTVGDGPAHAIVAAGPHPNEPIGGLTVVHLASRLCADPALRGSYTWHIVGCLDPDGTRLNEGWFAGPYTKAHYGRNFYRPAGDEQVEWTFPFSYKRAYSDRVMPETLALMRLIDATRPTFMTTLHNSELGGVFYYLSRPEPALQAVLSALPARYGLPLHAGEPEHPSITRLGQGVFLSPRMDDLYDYTEALGQDPATLITGAASDSYAARYGTLCLTAELPYWIDPSAGDTTPTADVYADLVQAQAADLRSTHAVLDEALRGVAGDVVSASPFLRASRYFVPLLAGMATTGERAGAPDNDRPAIAAERSSCRDLVHSFRLRFGGMLLRALEGEIAIGNGTPAIRRHLGALSVTYDKWCADAEDGTADRTVPIGHLVALQYGAVLAGAAHAVS
ncbi:M14 family zinc carboxypeptidase [Microtetraspora sp. NBRC 16547]|uniref:M14 family zinc carboxypeptidase n=1 Tax=Microtetraspora sp. NBRC 16547 TaxID=3030993 RepID=UPI0024A18014|nr:M14 family zinc carboxypeptidase [Microtetraspora sp. NBRC 16547]GLW99423.1 zinc carboxypeptidase [Microtetraspora sp. NBRC 16547]